MNADLVLELLRAVRADIAGLSERTERMELRLGIIESRLDTIESRLGVIESRLASVETSNQRRLERIEKRLQLSDE